MVNDNNIVVTRVRRWYHVSFTPGFVYSEHVEIIDSSLSSPLRELLEQVAEFEKTDFKTTDKVSVSECERAAQSFKHPHKCPRH